MPHLLFQEQGCLHPHLHCTQAEPSRPGIPQVLLRAPPAPPGPDHVLFDQFWVGTGGGPLPAPGEGEGVGQSCAELLALARWVSLEPASPQGFSATGLLKAPLLLTHHPTDGGGGAFVLTPTVQGHLRNLARAVLLRRYPILLQV